MTSIGQGGIKRTRSLLIEGNQQIIKLVLNFWWSKSLQINLSDLQRRLWLYFCHYIPSLATFCSAVSAVSKWEVVVNFMCFVFKTSVISNNCPCFCFITACFILKSVFLSLHFQPFPHLLLFGLQKVQQLSITFSCSLYFPVFYFLYTRFRVFSSCMTFSHFHGLWLLPGPHLFVCHVASLPTRAWPRPFLTALCSRLYSAFLHLVF